MWLANIKGLRSRTPTQSDQDKGSGNKGKGSGSNGQDKVSSVEPILPSCYHLPTQTHTRTNF